MKSKICVLLSTSLLMMPVQNATAASQASIIHEENNNYPEGVNVTNNTIYHPAFGEIKVISHKDDIDYYDSKVTNKDDRKELAEKFVEYVIRASSFEKISKDTLNARLQVIAESTSGMNMLKVITANYMREYDLLEEFFKKNKSVLYEYRDMVNMLNYHIKEQQEGCANDRHSEQITIINELKSRCETRLKCEYIKSKHHKIIGHQSFSDDMFYDLISEFGEPLSSEYGEQYRGKPYPMDKLKPGYTKTKENMYTQIKITNEGERSRYNDHENEITMLPVPNIYNCYLDKYGNVLPTNPSNDENSKYETLEHELFHVMNDITLNKIFNQTIDYCKDNFDPKWTESVTQGFKSFYKQYTWEGENYNTMPNLLRQIYDNPAEMLAMYGIAYFEGQVYYEPINEAVATTHIHYYNNELKPIIRTGHSANLEKNYVQRLHTNTKIYSYYFKNNEQLRKLITNPDNANQLFQHGRKHHRMHKMKF